MYSSHLGAVLTALSLSYLLPSVVAQTYSTCNPLAQSGVCPADPALGKSVDIDFTSGSSSEFSESGGPTYDSNGAAFTVAKSGDSPSISSKWYIMFGHVDFVIKTAPGTGIVSAAILQSDCLDEIDWEWLGGDDTQAQSNYFGKGQTTTGYNRGAFHSAPGNHDSFHTYSIDWTADQIVWSIDGTTVRAMTQAQAEANQYPQTPMYIKVGVWAGGDPSNAAGTIEWAGGQTDYSAGPFTMYLKSVHVTDYSTGSQYSYSGTSGTWQSIVSTGGQINSEGNGTPVSSSAPSVTSQVTTGSAPLAFGNGDESSTATRTGWPWSGTATTTAVTVIPTPSTSSLQVSPSGSASVSSPEVSVSVSPGASSAPAVSSGVETGSSTASSGPNLETTQPSSLSPASNTASENQSTSTAVTTGAPASSLPTTTGSGQFSTTTISTGGSSETASGGSPPASTSASTSAGFAFGSSTSTDSTATSSTSETLQSTTMATSTRTTGLQSSTSASPTGTPPAPNGAAHGLAFTHWMMLLSAGATYVLFL
nr:transglycosylase [Exophiala xenobiotica]